MARGFTSDLHLGHAKNRSAIRGRERGRVRAELHHLLRCDDPDDYEGDLTWEARRAMADLVADRREADKVGPLIQWATRTVATDPALATAAPQERLDHFRALLPPGLIGNHALSHLRWALGDDPYDWGYLHRTQAAARNLALRDAVALIVARGRHGELNRRIRAAVPPCVIVRHFIRGARIIDEAHPAPGVLVPARTEHETRHQQPRFLAGAHDIDAFVADVGAETVGVIRDLHRELVTAT